MNYEYLKRWYDEMMVRTEGRGEFLKFMFCPPTGSNDILIDLHGHTRVSDGTRSVQYYRQSATARKIKHASLTDHDNLGENETEPNFFNGVEITTHLGDNEIEILVYGYDQQKAEELINNGTFPFINQNFKYIRNVELTRRRIKLCNELGITDKPLTLSDILNIELTDENGNVQELTLSEIGINADKIIKAGEPLPEFVVYKNKICPISYRFLIKKLFNQIHGCKKGKAFLEAKAKRDSSYNPNSLDHFMKSVIANKYGELHTETEGLWPTIEDVVAFAKATGGVAILAHPFGYNRKINITTLDLIKKAYHLGIDGIEVFHGFNQSDEVEFLYKFCYEHGLLATMGSDTHGYISQQGGFVEPGVAPGVGHQMRYNENNIHGASTSLYNLFYYGTGAWRGETEFDHLSYPPSIYEVFSSQEEAINKSKNNAKKKKKAFQEFEPMA